MNVVSIFPNVLQNPSNCKSNIQRIKQQQQQQQLSVELNMRITQRESNDSLESNDTRLSSFQHFVMVVCCCACHHTAFRSPSRQSCRSRERKRKKNLKNGFSSFLQCFICKLMVFDIGAD